MDEELLKVLLPFAQAYHRLLLYRGCRLESKIVLMQGNCETELFAAMGRGSLESALAVKDADELLQVKHLRTAYIFLIKHMDPEDFNALGKGSGR